MLKFQFFILAFLFVSELYAQTLSQFASNEMKYWKLRGRLIGDDNNKDVYNGFVTIGDGAGLSIPAIAKHPSYKRDVYDFQPNQPGDRCKNQTIGTQSIYATYDINHNLNPGFNPIIDPRDGKDVKGVLRFSDNSLIQIGKYISVLAVEWALLNRDGADRTQTEMEIYYALKAIDRLDLAGETAYGMPADQNGFLMRNDVNENFQLNTNGKNIDLVISDIACKSNTTNCSESNATNPLSNVMSQDEVIGLLMGFALMKKMMPEYASYNGMALRAKSREITERIIHYVKTESSTNFWAIVDPIGHKRVCRGSMAIWNSYPMAATARYICGSGPFAFQNGWSLSLGYYIWQKKKGLYASNNIDSYFLPAVPSPIVTLLGLNTYSGFDIPGPGTGTGNHDGAYNVSMFLQLAAISKTASRPAYPHLDITGKYLINTVSQTYWKELYELLGSVITGYVPVKSANYWHTELSKLTCSCNCSQGMNAISALGCDNYHNFSGAGYAIPVNPWAVEDRYAYAMQPSNDANTHKEFNGLDYMLAYNLYRWKYFASGYANRVRTKCNNQNYPFLSLPNQYDNNNQYQFGSHQYPFKSKAVFSIDAWNTQLSATANVAFEAGSDIKLLPGFHAKTNSVFCAQIKEYNCQPHLINVPNASSVLWKNGGDSLLNIFYDFNIDTTVSIQVDADSSEQLDEVPNFDTSAYVTTYSSGGDTIYYDLHPDYSYTDEGEIVYTPPGSNKAALDPYTQKSIILYPNPSSGDVYLEYTLYKLSDIDIQVTNELGQAMSRIENMKFKLASIGKHKNTLNTASLASGIYFCQIIIDGVKSTKKFTICH